MFHILIVDDEVIIREGIRRVIPWEELGVEEVYLASSGEKALDVLEEHRVDLLLTDICMANMSGLNLIEQVNTRYPRIRIIVLTGYNSFEYAQQCCKMQVHNFLLKPVDEDELTEAIRGQIAVLQENSEQIKKQKVNSRVLGVSEQAKIENALKPLLERSDYNKGIMEPLLEEYGWKLQQNMQVIVILPLISQTQEWKHHYDLLYLSVKHICISLFDSRNQGITFEDDLGRVVVSVFLAPHLDEVQERVVALRRVLSDELDIPLNILMGSPVAGFEKLSISYHDAMTLLEISDKRKNEVLVPHKAEIRLKMFEDTVRELERIMEENTGDLEVLLKTYDTYIKCTNSYNLADASMRKTTYELISKLYYIYVVESGENCDNRLNGLLSSMMTENREEIGKIAREFIVRLFDSENKSPHELVRKAKRLIQENLSEDLSVTSLSEKLFVSTNYFSRLFKKETGQGCNEYIVGKRMEKARGLLETTSLKSGQIAQMVGYKDINYFSLAFKKNAGMSPTEYRESVWGREHKIQ